MGSLAVAALAPPRPGERILFVTGRLAQAGLERVVVELAEKLGFQPQVAHAAAYAFEQVKARYTPKPLTLHPVEE